MRDNSVCVCVCVHGCVYVEEDSEESEAKFRGEQTQESRKLQS